MAGYTPGEARAASKGTCCSPKYTPVMIDPYCCTVALSYPLNHTCFMERPFWMMARANPTFPLTSRHENHRSTLAFFICRTSGVGSAPKVRLRSLNETLRPNALMPSTAALHAAADCGTP